MNSKIPHVCIWNKKVGACLAVIAALLVWDTWRPRTIDRKAADEIANGRFKAHMNSLNRKLEDFASLPTEDRGQDWRFEWKAKDNSGSIIVLIEKNGEFADTTTIPLGRNRQ